MRRAFAVFKREYLEVVRTKSFIIMTLILPSVLFGIVAGVYVDRWDKRLVLIGSNVIRGGMVLGYPLISDFLGLVYIMNFAFSSIGQFFAPAEAAMIPALVSRRRLLEARSHHHLGCRREPEGWYERHHPMARS